MNTESGDSFASEEGSSTDPQNLTEFFLAHLKAKVSNPKCDCCGSEEWNLLTLVETPNQYSRLPHGPQKLGAKNFYWPTLAIACVNCYNVRLFAAAPILAEYKEYKKGLSDTAPGRTD